MQRFWLKHHKDSKDYIKYSNDMDNIYENIDEYNSHNERKILIVFDSIRFFVKGRKLNISLVFITQSLLSD